MASQSPTANLEMSGERVVAFFRVREDAFRAISELKEAGFTSNEIGLMSKMGDAGEQVSSSTPNDAVAVDTQTAGSELSSEHSESMWEKLKHFFSGDSADNVGYDDSSASLKWDQRRGDHYYRGIAEGGAVVTVSGTRTEEAREILQDAGGDLRDEGFENADYSEGLLPGSRLSDDLDSSALERDEYVGAGEEQLEELPLVRQEDRRAEDRRVHLSGEMFRSYRENSRTSDTKAIESRIGDNSGILDPDGDRGTDLDVHDLKKPAA